MLIRALQTSDLTDILELNRHLNAVDAPLPDHHVVETTWAQIVASTTTTCLGAVVEGKVVSSATVTVIPNLTRGCRPYALIENVVTHSDYRRRGYGSAVVKAALDLAWERGCYKALLLTGSHDKGVHKFYEQTGFNLNEKRGLVARPPT